MLTLEFPNESHKDQYLEMIDEWKKHEIPTSPGKLFVGRNFEEFLEIINRDLTDNEYGVNSTLFFLVEDTTRDILGAIHIRHHINHPILIEMGGHIGYGIRPTQRGRGFATKMLELALVEAKKLGLDRVLITCDGENTASAKVIEANGGVFERYAEFDGKKVRRYWIDIS